MVLMNGIRIILSPRIANGFYCTLSLKKLELELNETISHLAFD